MSYIEEPKRILVCDGTGLSVLDTPLDTKEKFLQYVITKGNNVWFHLVKDAVDGGVVDTADIVLLWKQGILALEHIKGIIPDEFFIQLLEFETCKISQNDLHFIFQQWLYRSESFPFSGKTIRRWFDNPGLTDGKVCSLIAIALYKTAPELISLKDISHKLSLVVSLDPASHGIHRLLFLALEVAGEDVDKQTEAMDMFVECCTILYFRERYTFEFLIEFIKESESWYETVRAIGLQKIKDGVEGCIDDFRTGLTNI